MIETTARVVSVEDNGIAWVETQRQSGCDMCVDKEGCGTSILVKLLSPKQMPIRALDTIQSTVGDQVTIGIQEHALLRGSLKVYISPLIVMISMALLGQYLWSGTYYQELGSTILGILGLGLGFSGLRIFAAVISTDARFYPVILRRSAPDRSLTTQ